MLQCYSELVDSIERGGREEPVAMSTDDGSTAAVSQIWLETTSYLLNRKELTAEGWALVSVILDIVVGRTCVLRDYRMCCDLIDWHLVCMCRGGVGEAWGP